MGKITEGWLIEELSNSEKCRFKYHRSDKEKICLKNNIANECKKETCPLKVGK